MLVCVYVEPCHSPNVCSSENPPIATMAAKLPSLLLLLVLFHNLSAVYSIRVNYEDQQEQEFQAAQAPVGQKTWCIPTEAATDASLQSNIDFACSAGVDCKSIQVGGACFEPNTVRSHAAFAMNAYYQSSGRTSESCDFKSTGMVTTNDPSYGQCVYQSG